MNDTFDPKTYGIALAASARGKSVSDVNRAAGFLARISGEELFCRSLCKIAATAYEQDGEGDSLNGIVFRRLADNRTRWKSGYRAFSDIVLGALGRCRMQKRALLEEALLAPTVMESLSPDALIRMPLAVGALAGATTGAVAHFLSRNSRQSSVVNEELLEKAREYRRLRMEIDEDMKNSGIAPDANDEVHSL